MGVDGRHQQRMDVQYEHEQRYAKSGPMVANSFTNMSCFKKGSSVLPR
jgi:hypothetical protein